MSTTPTPAPIVNSFAWFKAQPIVKRIATRGKNKGGETETKQRFFNMNEESTYFFLTFIQKNILTTPLTQPEFMNAIGEMLDKNNGASFKPYAQSQIDNRSSDGTHTKRKFEDIRKEEQAKIAAEIEAFKKSEAEKDAMIAKLMADLQKSKAKELAAKAKLKKA
jgi:hypothetical protein